MYKQPLRRSSNRIVAGVCAGIAEHLNIDPLLIRLLFIILFFIGVGSPILVYLIMALVMP